MELASVEWAETLFVKLSARTEYALKTLIELGLQHTGSVMKVADLAANQGIPSKFLAQILLALKAAGIVASQRGAQGGYCLARTPHDITVMSILQACGDPLCRANGSASPGPRSWASVTGTVIQEAFESIDRHVRSTTTATTLADLCDRAMQVAQGSSADYAI